MILDRIEHAAHYHGLGRGFAAGFAYLQQTKFDDVADGRYEIAGPDVVAIVQAYSAKPSAEGKWEAHRAHADIQFVASGAERMGVNPLEGMTVQFPYDAGKDVEFYAGDTTIGTFFDVSAGEFAVFFPHDVHMPSLAIPAQPQSVKKVVIKVRLR